MATRFSFSSLRIRLLLLVLLAVVPALGLMLYTAAAWRRHEAAEAQADALRLARHVAAIHQRLIEGARELLLGLEQLPTVRGGDPARCRKVISAIAGRSPGYANMGVIAPDGKLLCSALPTRDPIHPADLAHFRRAVETGDFAIGENQIGRLTGTATVNFAYPVLDAAGRLQAILFAALDPAWPRELAAETHLPAGATVTVFDQAGTILASHPDHQTWVGRSAREAPIFQAILTRHQEGTAEAVGIDGIRRLYGFRPLPGPPKAGTLYVTVAIPTTVAFAESNRVLARTLLGLGVAAALALAAAWVGGHVILLRRVKDLVGATQRLRVGDLSARTSLPHGPGEMGELAGAFDEMAAALQRRHAEAGRAQEALRKAHDELETRVRERTAELMRANEALQAEIAERKRAEEALRESRAQLAGIIGSAMDAIISLDADQRILWFNAAAEQMFRCPSADALGQPIDRFIPERFRAAHREHIRAFGQTNVTKRRVGMGSVVTGLRADAEEFPVEAAISQSEAGGRKVYTAILRDVSERQKAEQTLRESEERFRLLLNSTAEAIYGLDLQGKCTFCNPACARLLGVKDPSELLGKKMHALIHYARQDGTPIPEEDCKIYQAFRRGEGTHVDTEVLWRADGTSFPAEYWSYPVRRGEEVIGCVVTFLDITDRKQAEAQLRSSRELLRALAAHLQSVREDERTRIAREIHDELGQILTSLKIDTLRLAAKLPQDRAELVGNTSGMVELIDASLDTLRRIATELRPGVLDDLGLVSAIDWQKEEFQARTGIRCQFASEVGDLDLDRERSTAMFRILQEALTNVARHANATGVIIRLKKEDDTLMLTIVDNGRGITPREITDAKSLGLLGMRERAHILGGRVVIAGSPGQGSCVTVEIPLLQPPGAASPPSP